MLSVKIICVGRMREKYFTDAFQEYARRLSAYCSFKCTELQEIRLPNHPGDKDISAALPKDGYVVALCIEGRKLSSEQFAELVQKCENSGRSKICFLIGGSYGLSERIKQLADLKLSMSDMTFPHHLARVMVAEQIYRSFKIIEGSAYHK
jgi:23S rRNA (pseudouridine1915-N3)-methyltransferase